ncbi:MULTISPECIES: hypothetical protein [Hwangdonia]|uniref:Uncharacterized protein n=1 Tax=Hwangdonia seohaensis TaxID=1240727 RepID=A0ABW3RBM6_9FLAO|nr:hypothetical protein [Hwangdonia seohaensis]
MIHIKKLKVLFVIQFVMFYGIANAQTDTTDAIKKIGYNDTKTFKSTSQNHIPLVLQTHNGLLRFGKQNSYSLLPDGSHLSHKIVQAQGIDIKNAKLSESRQAFIQLLRMKYMAEVYKDLDKESFTVQASSMYKNEKNSLQAQNQLLKLANAVSSVRLINKYFCNPKINDCNYTPENFYRGTRHLLPWGGQGANEFRKLNSYTSYVSQHLEPLKNWSTSLFTNNTIDAYMVLTSRLGTYDFKNKGFWLSFHSSQSSWFSLRFYNLAPNTANERKLTSSNVSSILYKMPANNAEQFSEKTRVIYMVFKIKVLLKGIDPYREAIKSSFSLENSTIELYDTEDLKTKIGEISIDENLSVK